MYENEFELIPEDMAIYEPDEKLLEIMNNRVFKDKVLYEAETDFHSIKVVENEVGRFLHYGDTYQAGNINTRSYKGNLPYINYFLIPYLINPNIRKVLLIGMGSGRLIKDIETVFKRLISIDVVDIEEQMPEIAKKYFDFKPSYKFKFILADGVAYLKKNRKKYDLIIADVANNEGIDLRFLSLSWLNSVRKSLSDKGIYVSNMCASPDFDNPGNIFFREFFPSYKEIFEHNLVFKGDYSDKVYYKSFFNIKQRVIDITNVIIISSNKYGILSINEKDTRPFKKAGIDIKKYLADLYGDM